MAGRRHSYAGVAAGLNVLSRGVETGINRQLSQQDEERKFHHRLQELGIVAGIKSGQLQLRGANQEKARAFQLERAQAGQQFTLGRDEAARQFQAAQSAMTRQGQMDRLNRNLEAQGVGQMFESSPTQAQATTMPQTLSPGESYTQRLPGGITRTVHGQAQPTPHTIDPAQRAKNIAQLQAQLQTIEQRNVTGPMAASAEYQTKYKPPLGGFIGGFTDTPPNPFQQFFGAQQRPAAQAVPMTDTTFLRNQLSQLTGQSLQPSPNQTMNPATQATLEDIQSGAATVEEFQQQEAQLQAAGVDTEAIRRTLGL